MYFQHSSRIWTEFPSLAAGMFVVDGITADASVEPIVQSRLEIARRLLGDGPESQIDAVSAWRRTYRQMGLKPTKYRSAAEALLRRFRREDDLPRLHPLVDLCNAVSLSFALPVAVFDLENVDSFLEVRHANGDEDYRAFSGEIEHPAPDEVVFADAANHVHARRWTFRQSRQSTVRPETRSALIVCEAQHEGGEADIGNLLDILCESLAQYWAVPKHQAMVTADAPRFAFEV